MEAIVKETRSIKTKTTLSLPSAFKGETIPQVDPNIVCMSIVPLVLKTFTKKPSLQNLNWSRINKTKNACLDEADPNMRGMPHPTETNRGVRSDLAYDLKHRSHSRKITDEQAGNQDNEPSIIKSA